MKIELWIERFRKNSDEEVLDWSAPVTLDPSIRHTLAASLAIFQLGESGEGSTLFRYAEKVGATPGYERYPEALRLFLNEEHRHARMLAGMVARLDGDLLSKQWSADLFRWGRKLINIEFHLQIFLTAEIIAEAYYDLLRRFSGDPVIEKSCARILKDEIGHLGFHAAFFNSWMASWSPWSRRIWRGQFTLILKVVKWGVWLDHRRCFKDLGVERVLFFDRITKAERTFTRRILNETLPSNWCSIPGTRSDL
ncbi:MAG: ferritin-like domain-containing protein [Akkermansiaceae bacterium]|nr:ferritin-like domain-containing protein [Akkermansiaceae bacterium]